jgi:hypothetical protein
VAAPEQQLVAIAAPQATPTQVLRPAPSPWVAARRRFVRSASGWAGGLVLLTLVLAALFAARVAP